MDIIEEKEESVSQALDKAHECWRNYYSQTRRTRPNNFLLWKPQASLFGKIIWNVGSTINLFPNTTYKVDDFRCWRASLDDAWNDDWYNVGADLYEALSKAKVDLIDVRSAEHKSTFSAIEP